MAGISKQGSCIGHSMVPGFVSTTNPWWPNLGVNMPAGAAWAVANWHSVQRQRELYEESIEPKSHPVQSFNPRQRAVARLAQRIQGAK